MPTKTLASPPERFIIAKNAYELFLEWDPRIVGKLGGFSGKETYNFTYAWNIEFKRYFRGQFTQVSEMIKFYDRPEAFIASLDTQAHLLRAEKLVEEILKVLPSDGSALVFAALDAVSLALALLILRTLGANNTVVNFLSSPTINGSTKSFEAYILLLAAESSPTIKKLIDSAIKRFKVPVWISEHFFYLEEDEVPPPYTINALPEALRAQAGIKASRMVYRLGMTPDQAFIENEKISHLILIDSAGQVGPTVESLRATAQTLGTKKLNVVERASGVVPVRFVPGIYESYLLEKSQEYSKLQLWYTKVSDALLHRAKSTKVRYNSDAYPETSITNRVSYSSEQIQAAVATAKEKRSIALLYLGVIPLLFLGLIVTLGAPSTNTSTNTRTTGGGWWISNWSSGAGGGSWSSNASKSTDSISKSFWGGGFSRGGGGSFGGGG